MNLNKIRKLGAAIAIVSLNGCTGIFESIYDKPDNSPDSPSAGQLYVDASDWGKWHYIDIQAVADSSLNNPQYDPNDAWISFDIPKGKTTESDNRYGIYTYWYDVFSEGIKVNEFRSFQPTSRQQEPENWTIAIHRNNVRTNGCTVARTPFHKMEELTSNSDYLKNLDFVADSWSENEVWCEQSKMLLGLIGSQGIEINPLLSSWLKIDIPPMPPSFTLCDNVFVVRLPDNSFAAIQLANYLSPSGTKCCMTINYRYPL